MSWHKYEQCCANCAFWMGNRQPSAFGLWEVNSPGDRGKCAQNVFCGVTQGPTAMQGTDCKKFVRINSPKK